MRTLLRIFKNLSVSVAFPLSKHGTTFCSLDPSKLLSNSQGDSGKGLQISFRLDPSLFADENFTNEVIKK